MKDLNPQIKALIKKTMDYRPSRFRFYFKEKDGEYTIMGPFGAIYDLLTWSMKIWGCKPNKPITGLDENGEVAYFKIGGNEDAEKTPFFDNW